MQEVDYEAELILSTLMESHAGPAAAEAAAAATARGGAAAAGLHANGGDVRTPGGAGIETPLADGGGRGSGRSGGQAGDLGLSPAPGLTGRRFPGATVARPASAGAGEGQHKVGWCWLTAGSPVCCWSMQCLLLLLWDHHACCSASPPCFAGPSRFGQEAQQQADQQQQQQQPPQQQQQQQQQAPPAARALQRPRPSGLVDDGSLWARSGERPQASELHPLGGDAGPMLMEQDEVSWEEEVLPLSLPPPNAPASTLPPGAIL